MSSLAGRPWWQRWRSAVSSAALSALLIGRGGPALAQTVYARDIAPESEQAVIAAIAKVGPAVAAQEKTPTEGIRRVTVTIEKRTVVNKSDKTNFFPNIHRMANGNLIAMCQTAADETAPEATEVGRRFISMDNGETWRELGVIDAGGPSMVTLRDGTFLQLWFYTVRADKGWVTKVVRSSDNGLTYSTEENVPVYVDNVKEGKKQTGMCFDGGLVEMDHGDLLATMYGYFEGDQKYRCALARSTDKGHSWNYASTIAYDPAAPAEGFCEAAMIRTGGAGLLVTMRSGGSAPMYQSCSTDGGLTWTKPTVAADRGVEPDLVYTGKGILVCSYGRPNVYVMCSADGRGRSWTDNTLVYQGQSTCYTGMARIARDSILLVHDALGHTEPGDDKPYNCVFAVRLKVQ